LFQFSDPYTVSQCRTGYLYLLNSIGGVRETPAVEFKKKAVIYPYQICFNEELAVPDLVYGSEVLKKKDYKRWFIGAMETKD
jgi:hypothetical protein